MKTVCFAHGRESGPRGRKILELTGVAERSGWSVESIDFRATADPDRRVEMLCVRQRDMGEPLVLAGSSMGGYVVTCASAQLRPAGLFLMAPAFYLPGYAEPDPVPVARQVEIVHGWRDTVVPAEHVLRFARSHRALLHLVDDGHRLAGSIPFLKRAFADFLERTGQPPEKNAEAAAKPPHEGAAELMDAFIQSIRTSMVDYFGADRRRIDHADRVAGFALELLAEIDADRIVTLAAAYLHDIGIPEAERKFGSSAGKFQEQEGPPVARRLLEELDAPASLVDRVCELVGCHHTPGALDTPEFRVLWDADALVNLAEVVPGKSAEEIRRILERSLTTDPGLRRALRLYGP